MKRAQDNAKTVTSLSLIKVLSVLTAATVMASTMAPALAVAAEGSSNAKLANTGDSLSPFVIGALVVVVIIAVGLIVAAVITRNKRGNRKADDTSHKRGHTEDEE